MHEFSVIFNSTLFFFCILALSALGGMFSERAGIVNIGIEGMMIIGAAGYLIATDTIGLQNSIGHTNSMFFQLIVLPVAGLFGALFSVLHGFATIKLKSDHTISGFAINLLAVGLALVIIKAFGHKADKPIMDILELKYVVVIKSSGYANKLEVMSLKFIMTILAIVISGFVLYKTAWGLRFRSVGENPQAADVLGINVSAYKWQGVLISGFLAGLAGGIFVQENYKNFQPTGDVDGLGYIALAIMIMGQWRVTPIALVSLVFGIFYSFVTNILVIMPSQVKIAEIVKILPFILTLLIVGLTSKNSKAPAADGLVYDKSKR